MGIMLVPLQPTRRERVDDREFAPPAGRDERGDGGEDDREQRPRGMRRDGVHAEVGEPGAHVLFEDRTHHELHERVGEPRPGPGEDADGERLADDEDADVRRQEAEGSQHAVLARALAHAHGDGVAEDHHA